MRLFILFSFAGIVFSNSIPLSQVFEEEIIALGQTFVPFDHLKDTDHECVKNKLKLSEIGDKLIAQELGKNSVRTAAVLCMKDKSSSYEKMVRFFSKNIPTPDNLECYKRRLKELKADSKFLSDFIPDSSIKCDQPIRKFEGRKEMFQNLGVYDCVISKNTVLEKNGLRILLIKKFLNDPNGINNDIKKEMVEDLDADNEVLLECILEKIE